MKVAFIGLGTMGMHMAVNLRKADHDVYVYNRTRSKAEAFVTSGGTLVESPREAAEQADFVLSCVSMPEDVEEVFLGDAGAIHGSRPGQVFVDHSTIDPATAKSIGAVLAEKQIQFIDAPISGGPMGAEAGTLAIMAGGEADAFAKAEPLFQAMGGNIFHVGPLGAGSVVKLQNQLLVGINLAGIAEAMVLGVKNGVDPEVSYKVLGTAMGDSRMLHRAMPDFILKRNFDPAFAIKLLVKDLRLATQLGQQASVRLLISNLTQLVYEEAIAQGLADEDQTAVVKPLEELAKVEVAKA